MELTPSASRGTHPPEEIGPRVSTEGSPGLILLHDPTVSEIDTKAACRCHAKLDKDKNRCWEITMGKESSCSYFQIKRSREGENFCFVHSRLLRAEDFTDVLEIITPSIYV
ncbi:hypothetical protein ElyMa_006582100 [Elysia marginata]|uniref:Apple domain-containing protein n=1 Tax=Elysia marginata TaxID=1093978 RepID=A0AAV4IC09_9GAST|nr:hypothetical protein ElyMa_006582100 [Elysia marginata]